MTNIENNLAALFESWCGEAPLAMSKLPGSGSYRSYYRINGKHGVVIGAHNEDIRENEAFIAFTTGFRHAGVPVPEVLASDPVNRIYLLSDLGDVTLYQFLTEKRAEGLSGQRSSLVGSGVSPLPSEVMDVYKKAIAWLSVIQVKAGALIDYTLCYPRAAFDRQSMMWDLNYFKYYFLKLAKIPFDEQALEDDFAGLCDLLLAADAGFFLFRDFQSRNIMVVHGEPWFIDYQGGRKGALQYDVASLLYDGKADLSEPVRMELLDFYLDKLEEIYPVNREKFLNVYYGFVLIRILQALGAYGFRGYYEQKSHFLQSIPFALKNLKHLRAKNLVGFGLNTLMEVIDTMVANEKLYNQESVKVSNVNDIINKELPVSNSLKSDDHKLTVTIHSFSFKRSIPADASGNGGGFVFDCRALPNPGRLEEYKHLNGKDQPVIDYLKNYPEVNEFLANVFSLVDQSVKTYVARDFQNLMVSFGCTGGQHRSVYCAETMAKHLASSEKVHVNLRHIEQEITHP
jgi:aminoglycoside/choline kinase family phosphotransferase